ncbi:hypothetical protein E2566_12695 [Pectobacterium punjabense]|uniref:Uncharacterized protein n=1 Tax=Pectobacterium punjabense TaxID=2108399 RepID=A0ABX6L309_9GAMM|nr:hypothetical protein C9I36_00790 [Pectobacterium punjabense]QJA20728.1 hypothetical protein E2566_12695 [Pectobacterium punjabense]
MLTSVWTTKFVLTKSNRAGLSSENGAHCAPFFLPSFFVLSTFAVHFFPTLPSVSILPFDS